MADVFAFAKLGEDVCIHRTGWDGLTTEFQAGKIEKITKTQITALGRRWMRSTGREVGCNAGYRIRRQKPNAAHTPATGKR